MEANQISSQFYTGHFLKYKIKFKWSNNVNIMLKQKKKTVECCLQVSTIYFCYTVAVALRNIYAVNKSLTVDICIIDKKF